MHLAVVEGAIESTDHLRVRPIDSLESLVAGTLESFSRMFGCWGGFLLALEGRSTTLADRAVRLQRSVLAIYTVLPNC